MAFDVTPSSGAGPYTLTASFANASLLDGVTYALELRASIQDVSCNTGMSEGTNQPGAVQSLLDTGSHVAEQPVNPTLCRTYSLIIRDVVNNTVIQFTNAYIDNL